MFNRESFESSQRPTHRVEQNIPLIPEQEAEIIDDLTRTVDELRFFAEPVSIMRSVNGVDLIPDTKLQLPASFRHLDLEQASLTNGNYKTKITLPGRILRLEGDDDTRSRKWSVTSGKAKEKSINHTDLIAYLQTSLPQNSALDELADSPFINDQTVNETLWRALSPLASTWRDTRAYSADSYSFSQAPSESIDDYMSEIGAAVRYTETPDSDIYSSRISTTTEVTSSLPTAVSDGKYANVRQEYHFGVEFFKRHEHTRKALATLALESSDLADGRLNRISNAQVLYLDKVPAIYQRANEIVKNTHLVL